MLPHLTHIFTKVIFAPNFNCQSEDYLSGLEHDRRLKFIMYTHKYYLNIKFLYKVTSG